MNIPPLRDFLENSFYFQRHYPKWANVRKMFFKEMWGAIPLFYVFIYPPLLGVIWLLSSVVSKIMANGMFSTFTAPGGLITRYDAITTSSVLAEALRQDMMSIALLPVSLPWKLIMSISDSTLGDAIGAVFSLVMLVVFLGAMLVVVSKGVFKAWKLMFRLMFM